MVKKKELSFKDNLKKNNISIIYLKLLFKKIIPPIDREYVYSCKKKIFFNV